MKQDDRSRVAAKDAKYGEKMVEISIRFWTNNIEEGGQIRPRHAWSKGMVGITRNKSHAIVPKGWRPFNSLPEIGSVIERVLIEHNIVLHQSDKMKKYMAEQPLTKKKPKKSV